ncbi:Sec-dependent nitrous-oxide reductase [Rhodocaloribacter litoris]|uniref:Sec-dependent nitrous-oxide reductase n=1 Tax=Rhodocaloribacter litoris TaxID=2558931 RepID=UPI00141FAB1B|nr:Sec-dependent nitrous-oxide reductase [Rhodocaloribacter litoris]QXD16001.1 Sec-dependent nitrous-oxide reductase [Rhodocaloribacter litoris]
MNPTRMKQIGFGLATVVLIAAIGASCAGSQQAGSTDDAASKVYVPPGQHDEFYAFMSGGFSGNLTVHGLPSGRLLKTVPVFSQFPENGYGYTEETRAMLMTSHGFIPWDDAHHPELSQTDGVPDGRWIFINGNNTPRVARIDLSTFETEEIVEIPNSAGNHGSPFITQNTEYLVASTRFSVPVPQRDMSIDEYKGNFKGMLTFIKADTPGEMDIAFQILVPGYNYDLAHAGKGPSHGWMFFTSYNTEEAHTLLEVNASQNDKDFVAAVNWKRAEQCIADGKARQMEAEYYHNHLNEARIAVSEVKRSVTVLEPADCEGLVYFLPTPKSPHGVDVDPSGEYIVAGGKLATVIPVHSFSKMLQAIEDEKFEKVVDGIPVLQYDAVIAGEVENAGLGPLHTEFDGKGYAYTTAFISSEIVKWELGTWQVVDRIPVYYSVGHLMIPGGDSRKPWGKYLVALNKITKDRYLPTGPELAHAAQLIDISGDKMKLLLDFPTMGEPHYAQGIHADLIKPRQVQFYQLQDNKHPYAVKSEAETRVERDGNTVHVYMSTIRTHFSPDNIEGIQVGDEVYFHVTNLEQDWDVPHGFAVIGANNAELLIMPGETRTLKWVPRRAGVFPFYCTDFCSALHQEMQGYIRVSPRGANVPLAYSTGQ